VSENALAGLLAGYLDGDLEPQARAELAAAVEHDSAAAREFDAALRTEALLRAAHLEFPARDRISAGVRARMKPARNWWLPAFAAAAALAAVCGASLALREPTPAPAPVPVPRETPALADNQLLSGTLLINGEPAREIPNGSRVQVNSAGGAVVRLADGSRARFLPRSTALLRGPADGLRQVVALERGKALFNVEQGARQFRVDTPSGRVTVTGTRFSVELECRDSKGDEKVKGKLGLAMIVVVAAGSVSVEYDGETHRLTTGQQRVFGAEGEKRPEKRKSRLPEGVRGFSGSLSGTVVARGEKHSFTFKIQKVLKTWKGNKAKRPQALVGQTIRIGPRWEKKRKRWRPSELHLLFIRKLEPRRQLDLEIANHEGDHFSILELTADQREWARKGHKDGEKREGEKREGEHRDGEKRDGEKRDGEHRDGDKREGEKHDGEKREGEKRNRPRRMVLSEGKSSARFVGVVKRLKKAVLYIRIEKIKGQATWKHPKTGSHEAKAGSTVGFCAQWEKRGDRWRPSRREMKIFRELRPGDRVECGAYFDEHPRLRVIEVEGRKREGEKREGDRHNAEKKKDREHGDKDEGKGEKKERDGKEKQEEKKEGKGDDWDF
jgi:ferric-dicitrate binding protein FerR (iron transport regulator)